MDKLQILETLTGVRSSRKNNYVELQQKIEHDEEALKQAEERFSKVFRSSPYMMLIIKKSDYRCIDVNQRFLTVMGLLRQEVIQKKPIELGLEENIFYNIINLLDQLGSIDNIESHFTTQHGTIILIISAQEIVLNDEQCILFAANDITDMKRLQTEVARLDRLNLIGQMAAGIAHEIRNPMTTIRGYLQLLGAKPEYQAIRSTLDIMIGELDRANSIITEFLSVARNKPTDLQCQNINEILQNLFPLLEADTFVQDKKIVFEAKTTPDILLNRKEISQLVLNLCRNGLEAMQEGGTLTIRIYCEDEQVVLAINDEGSGIPLEYMDKLGTPFFTTRENGTGLGLATCYSIAERHNAKIEVESSDRGSTFFVRFPVLRIVNN